MQNNRVRRLFGYLLKDFLVHTCAKVGFQFFQCPISILQLTAIVQDLYYLDLMLPFIVTQNPFFATVF
jgi:hypothetical protein